MALLCVRGRSQTTFTRGGGRWSKKLTFCKLLYHRKCKRRGVGGQKKTNLVNIVCERPLIIFGLVFNIYSTILSSLFRKLLRFLHQSLPRVSCDTEDYVLIVTRYLKAAGSRVAQNRIKNSKGASRLSYIPVRFHEIFLKNSHVLRLIRKLKKFSR